MKIKKVTDPEFRMYGKVLDGYDTRALEGVMEKTPCPKDKVIYVPSDVSLEKTAAMQVLWDHGFGQMPIQIGYCNGNNHQMNAMEYHRSSEIDIAISNLILLLGRQQDIAADRTYDSGKIEAFLIPKGTVVEIYATTLHYAPISVEKNGFRCVIVLPEGTNTELEKRESRTEEDCLLFAKNKWLLAHPDANIEGAFCGIKGENLRV